MVKQLIPSTAKRSFDKNRLALFAVFGLSLFSFYSLTFAADASVNPQPQKAQIVSLSVDNKNDFVVEPGKMEIYVNPGDIVTKYISVTSRIAKKTAFKVTTEDFVGTRDEQNPVMLLGNEKSPYSFKDSLVPALSDFDLNFGDRITLPVRIEVAQNAQPGGYYASVIVANDPQGGANADTVGNTRVVSRVGVLFFIRVNGPVNQSGHVEDFRVKDSQWIYSKAPSAFDILFNNTGTVHLAPYGHISITNLIGKEVSDLPVDAYFSLPDSLRYRTVNWVGSGFRIGRYKATLTLNRGYDGVIDTKVIAFWVLPWKIIVGALVLIFLLVSAGYMIVSRFELRLKK